MCLRFACFGVDDPDDDFCSPSAKARTPHYPPPPAQRNGYHGHQGFHHGNGYHGHAQQQQQQGFHHGNGHRTSHHQTAADEADRKASSDTKRGHVPAAAAVAGAAATRGGHGYAAGAQEKAYTYYGAAEAALKHPAMNTKTADGVGHGAQDDYYYYYEAHKEDTADYHYPAATAATADHERY